MRSTNTELARGDGRMKLLVREMDRTKGRREGEGQSAALALLLVSRFWLSFWWSKREVAREEGRGGGRLMREGGGGGGGGGGGSFNCRNAWCCWG